MRRYAEAREEALASLISVGRLRVGGGIPCSERVDDTGWSHLRRLLAPNGMVSRIQHYLKRRTRHPDQSLITPLRMTPRASGR